MQSNHIFLRTLLAGVLSAGLTASLFAQGETLKTDLVAYWPLDEVQGTKTPDKKNSYDLNLTGGLTAAQLVPGIRGNAFQFNGTTHLLSRLHASSDDLPVTKHSSFTVSFWTKTNFSGQVDRRLFSEGSELSNTPLFNLGTYNVTANANASIDVFIRPQTGATVNG